MKVMSWTLFVVVAAVGVALPARAERQERRQDGYILLTKGGTHIASLDLESFQRVHEKLVAPVLWVWRGRAAYEIRDPEILARADAVMAPVTAAGREHDAWEKQQEPLRREEERLDREEERLERDEDRLDDDASETKRAALEERRRALDERQKALSERMDGIEAEERQRDAHVEQLEAVAEGQLKEIIADAFARDLAVRVKD